MSVIVSSLRKQRVNISLRKISMGKLGTVDPWLSELFSLRVQNLMKLGTSKTQYASLALR